MSSKKNETVTKDPSRPALVPKLRFPEFEGEWEEGVLDDALVTASNGLSLPQSNVDFGCRVTRIETISSGAIDLEKVGFVKPAQDISDYLLQVGDILFSNINSLAHIGKSVYVDDDYGLYHGMNLLRLVVNKRRSYPKFLFYLINTGPIRESFRERANKAVNQASINQTELGKTRVPAPTLPEQQRIADCLSSLDDLITAQSRKVEALKTHKKGLMQQLFPREGETQPLLRFPEFEGEWKVKSFAELFVIGSGRDYKHLQTGEVPVYGTGGYMLSVNEALYDGESVCIGRKGTIDNPMLLSGRFWTVDTLFYTHSFMECLPSFVFAIFQMIDWRSHNEGGGVPSLSKANIQRISAALPSLPEQQRIVDCLGSLDELITNESNKLEAYKTHKKGLMQQLFPTISEN